jgi:hypothetical protein
MKKTKSSAENKRFFESVKSAMPGAARRARKAAKMFGTPICIWQDGKVVTIKP